ncbi:MAG: hypothetical protein KBF82_13750 [Chitinophagaceae bacterium]|nr:hypothetical protein [Chitinophagaceae bacterium]MBP9104924.1 hypothetical protein [Chitinophagaceae bacterium]
MKKVVQFVCGCMLFSTACSYKQQATVSSWEISYRRVEYFFGHIDIKIGTDSCYYLNQGGIHKNPPIFKWNSSKQKLNELYKQVESFHLEKISPVKAHVTEEPFESIMLVENGKLVFEVVKHQQNNKDIAKFDSVLTILKSFAASENNGWKY